MGELNVLMTICALLALTLPAPARHYDIEAEAQRLYGEDLASVLRKFRRSTDYMYLLQEKHDELNQLFSDVYLRVFSRALLGALRDKVAAMCGVAVQPADESLRALRGGGARGARGGRGRRASGEAEAEEAAATRGPVAQLDDIVHARGLLTTPERNRARDVGFEVAGQAVHMIIDAMGPAADGAAPSTRLTFGEGGGNAKTTTERDHRHTIATGAPGSVGTRPPAPRPPPSPVDETLRAYHLQRA